MVHKYASYEEFRDHGMFSTEANCMQYLYDMKILRTNQQCPTCRTAMKLKQCPTTRYREACCWKCSCGRTIAPKVGGVLHNSNITYEDFIKILAFFAEGMTVRASAQQGNLSESTVRRFFNKIHEQIAQEMTTSKTKNRLHKKGRRKTDESLQNEWRKQKGLMGEDARRQIFSHELPSLLYYRKFA